MTLGICELKKLTTVYSNGTVRALPSFWIAGNAVRFTACSGSCIGYAHVPAQNGGIKTLDRLPVEFFNWELAALDVNDEPGVFEFVTKWGFPFSPLNNNESVAKSLLDIGIFEEHANAVGVSENAYENALNANCEELRGYEYIGCDVISYEECRIVLTELQGCVTGLLAAIADEGKNPEIAAKAELSMRFINMASSNPQRIGSIQVVDSGSERANGQITLTNAICNQIVDTISDSTPWRLCANSNGRKPCGRIFKHARTESKTHDNDARFCCRKCSNADKQRRKRNRDKEADPAQ